MELNFLEFFPKVIADLREIQALAVVFEDARQELNRDDEELRNLIRVEDYSIETCAHWEKIYGITPLASDTLEDRRFRLKARKTTRAPYTRVTVERKLKELCGSEVDVFVNYLTLYFYCSVPLGKKKQFDEVVSLLLKVLPMSLVVNATLKYNTHRYLAEFTHRELAQYTQQQLREERLQHLVPPEPPEPETFSFTSSSEYTTINPPTTTNITIPWLWFENYVERTDILSATYNGNSGDIFTIQYSHYFGRNEANSGSQTIIQISGSTFTDNYIYTLPSDATGDWQGDIFQTTLSQTGTGTLEISVYNTTPPTGGVLDSGYMKIGNITLAGETIYECSIN